MGNYWLAEPRKAIICLQVTVETNLPDDGIKELAVSWAEHARAVCKSWAEAGPEYSDGLLRVIGTGHYQLIPYGTKETGPLLLENHAHALKAADDA